MIPIRYEKRSKIIFNFNYTLDFFRYFFIPFVNLTDELNHFCRYRFAIYECWICESEGEGCTSDFYLFNVELSEKIGGPLEYFGIKEIEKDSIK